MKKLLPRRLTTAGLLTLLHLLAQVTPAHCATRPARARGNQAAAQTQIALADSLPESDFLLVIDYKRLFNEAFPRILADQRELREGLVKEFDEVMALTGLDLRAAGRVVTGVRSVEVPGSKEQARHTAVSLVRGVDHEKWLAFVRQKGPGAFKESRHGSKPLLILKLTAEQRRKIEAVTLLSLGDEGLAFAALDADTLAYGTPDSVRAAVEARAGSGAKISSELAAAATRNPDALLGVVGLVPPSLTADYLPGGKQEGNEFVKMLSNVKRCSLAVEMAPAAFTVTVACGTGSPEQAKALGDIVTAFKTLTVFSKAKSPQDRIGVEFLKTLAVSTAGDEVSVKSVLPDSAAKAIVLGSVSVTYVASGNEHQNKGELAAALADYDRALVIDPQNVNAYINRGLLRSEKGELEAAEADQTKAIALDPDNATAYSNRGFVKSNKGAYEAAIVDLEKAIALDPRHAYAYNNRGQTLAALGRHEEALADYDKSIALDSENAISFYNRGQSRYELGDHARAIADFDKALALNPRMADAYNNRGFARSALGEYEAAIADHGKALVIDPKSAEAYSGRGNARFQLDEYDAAIADYDKAIALDPAPPAYSYSNRGFARAAKGDIAGAIVDFEKSVAVNPELSEGYRGRGFARFELGEYAAAVADFDKAIAVEPEYAEAYGFRGLALLAQRKDAAAARDLKKCFELDGSLRTSLRRRRRRSSRPAARTAAGHTEPGSDTPDFKQAQVERSTQGDG